MITHFDNFLDAKTFTDLNQYMLSKKIHVVENENQNGKFGDLTHTIGVGTAFFRYKVDKHDLIILSPIIAQIKECLKNVTKSTAQQHYASWFQYMNNNQRAGKHFDGAVNNKHHTRSYSAFIYTHTIWEDHYGGELCVKGTETKVYPNRLVIYSRDEEHWTNSILHDQPTYQRMFFATSWSVDY